MTTGQTDLFGDGEAPLPSAGKLVRLAHDGGAAGLSKTQKAFNRWISKIEDQRRQLSAWQAFLPTLAAEVGREMVPLQARMRDGRVAMLRYFDTVLAGKALAKRDRETLTEVLCDMSQELLEGLDDPALAEELVALHDRHSGISHAEAQQEDVELARAMAEELLGKPLDGAEGAQTPEEVMAAVMREMQEQSEKRARAAASAPRRPRSAKAAAREAAKAAQQQAQAEQTTQSVREVYRKLASALHPDREPDPAERARKTALMQRVNQAYERRDLLQLLELQMAAEQIDATRLAGVSEERLQHYVQVLKEQSQGLEQEIQELLEPLMGNMPLYHPGTLTPEVVRARLKMDARELQRDCDQVEEDLKDFQDVRALKVWIKEYRRASRESQRGFDPIEALLARGFDMPGGRRR